MKLRLALTLEVTRSRPRVESAAAEPPYVDEASGSTVETFAQPDYARPQVGFTPEPDWDDRRRR